MPRPWNPDFMQSATACVTHISKAFLGTSGLFFLALMKSVKMMVIECGYSPFPSGSLSRIRRAMWRPIILTQFLISASLRLSFHFVDREYQIGSFFEELLTMA